jgi:hypothetical protein
MTKRAGWYWIAGEKTKVHYYDSDAVLSLCGKGVHTGRHELVGKKQTYAMRFCKLCQKRC